MRRSTGRRTFFDHHEKESNEYARRNNSFFSSTSSTRSERLENNRPTIRIYTCSVESLSSDTKSPMSTSSTSSPSSPMSTSPRSYDYSTIWSSDGKSTPV